MARSQIVLANSSQGGCFEKALVGREAHHLPALLGWKHPLLGLMYHHPSASGCCMTFGGLLEVYTHDPGINYPGINSRLVLPQNSAAKLQMVFAVADAPF